MVPRKKSKSKDKPKVASEQQGDDSDLEARYRIYSVVSYLVVLIVIGLPVWWYTTRVYRASLPLDEMYNVEVPPKTIRENSIPLSLEYDVLITIVNPDPSNLKVDLDGRNLETYLNPFLNTVSSVANFTVKSQWLYLENLHVTPGKVNNKFVIEEKRLPYIITPLETKLWSHMSPRPVLNLVVFVSKCDRPLYIIDSNKQFIESNAFLSPRWGGIQILNAGEDNCKNKTYKPDIKSVISIFLHQLKQLIGLKGDTRDDVHDLERTKTIEMIESTRRTLKSLAQLLSEISSIVISDDVANRVKTALKRANEAEYEMRRSKIKNALINAKEAFLNSEQAFSDPSLLALLYFPDDQKYAVYIPLFLPIMIPVLMSLTTVRRWYVGEKKVKVD